MAIASSTPSLHAKDRAIEGSGSIRDSTSTTSTLDHNLGSPHSSRMLEPPPLRSSSYQLPPRPASRSPRGSPAKLAVNAAAGAKSTREDSAYYIASGPIAYSDGKGMDWDFETGSPVDHRSSIGGGRIDLDAGASPNDSGYAATEPSSRRGSGHARRESATLPALFKAVEEEYDAVAGSSRRNQQAVQVEQENVSPKSQRSTWRSSKNSGHLPPPAIPSEYERLQPVATPTSVFSQLQRSRTNPVEERYGQKTPPSEAD